MGGIFSILSHDLTPHEFFDFVNIGIERMALLCFSLDAC